jgi:hypothetical protein
MAKVIGPLLSLSASGSVADTFTHRNTMGRAIVGKKIRTQTSRSDAQLARRAVYQGICSTWNSFTGKQKEPWIALGKARGLTGFNAYCSSELIAAYAATPHTYTTLDNVNIGNELIISNGNLTVAKQYGSGGHQLARSMVLLSSGKWYWEAQSPNATGTYLLLGIANENCDTATYTYLGGDGNSYGYSANGGTIFGKKHAEPDGAAWGDGDVIGLALDCDAHILQFYKNGEFQTEIAVEAIPWYAAVSVYSEPTSVTMNFGASPLAYPLAEYNEGIWS